MSCLVSFENRNILFYYKNTLAYYTAGVAVAYSQIVGCEPGRIYIIPKMKLMRLHLHEGQF
jgi:hypothetical protein